MRVLHDGVSGGDFTCTLADNRFSLAPEIIECHERMSRVEFNSLHHKLEYVRAELDLASRHF